MPDPDIIAQHEVAHSQVAVSTKEPCAAVANDLVFCTHGNFIGVSIDRGTTFPFALAGSTIFGGLPCGDQSVIWIPQIQRFAWAMLVLGGVNRMRLALSSPAKLENSGARNWLFLELDPANLGLGGMKFDYPQLALGDRMLYITMMFSGIEGESNVGALIIRISLDQLAREEPSTVGFQYFTATDVKQFCAAQDLGNTCFWAGHLSNETLRHYCWDENSGSIQFKDVAIPAFNDDLVAYTSLTPDGKDWVDHLDRRITGGARVSFSGRSDDLVFAWTAGRQAPQRPAPYIYLAMLRFERATRTSQLVGTRDIFHEELAWAFPALGGLPRAGGLLAMSCGWGGEGRFFANQSVGFVDLPISNNGQFRNITIAKSTIGAPRWGDFVCVRHQDPLEAVFVTAGFRIDAPTTAGGTATSRVYVSRFAPFPL